MAVDDQKLHELVFKMVGEMGAAAVAPLVVLGDRLGLYRTLAADGPLSSDELARRTGTAGAMSVSGARPRPPRDTSSTTRPAARST